MDAAKEVKEEILARFRSPFIGAFVLAWLLCHWDLIVVLVYGPEAPFKGRLAYINQNVAFDGSLEAWRSHVFAPARLALIYIVVHLATQHAYYYLDRALKNFRIRRDIQDKLDNQDLEKYHDLLLVFVSLQNSYLSSISENFGGISQHISRFPNATGQVAQNLSAYSKNIERQIADWRASNAVLVSNVLARKTVPKDLRALIENSKLKKYFWRFLLAVKIKPPATAARVDSSASGVDKEEGPQG